jgi:TetR/AcrR family transcriptional regulator, repressor of fatR-cypB operon
MAPEVANAGTKLDLLAFKPRERILAAALKLFVEQGYFNTNVPDLSRESKCSVGSIYHTFKNKEEIAKALYQEGLTSFRGALANSVKNKKEIEDIITCLVRSFLEFSEVNHQLSRYIWLCRHNEFMGGIIRHPTMVGYDQLGRTLAKSIKKAIRDEKIRPISANLMWSIIFGIPLAYVRDWLDGYNTEPPSRVSKEIARTCWQALVLKQQSGK